MFRVVFLDCDICCPAWEFWNFKNTNLYISSIGHDSYKCSVNQDGSQDYAEQVEKQIEEWRKDA